MAISGPAISRGDGLSREPGQADEVCNGPRSLRLPKPGRVSLVFPEPRNSGSKGIARTMPAMRSHGLPSGAPFRKPQSCSPADVDARRPALGGCAVPTDTGKSQARRTKLSGPPGGIPGTLVYVAAATAAHYIAFSTQRAGTPAIVPAAVQDHGTGLQQKKKKRLLIK